MHQDSRTDPVTLDPDKFKIRMENERIRVLEASIPSGEGSCRTRGRCNGIWRAKEQLSSTACTSYCIISLKNNENLQNKEFILLFPHDKDTERKGTLRCRQLWR